MISEIMLLLIKLREKDIYIILDCSVMVPKFGSQEDGNVDVTYRL